MASHAMKERLERDGQRTISCHPEHPCSMPVCKAVMIILKIVDLGLNEKNLKALNCPKPRSFRFKLSSALG